MYIPCNKPKPVGTNPPLDTDRQPIWRAKSGEDLSFTTRAYLQQGAPVTPENSKLSFKLAENRFHFEAIWEGEWLDGIEAVDSLNHPGLIRIRVPDEIASQLRRGVYSFSLAVSDRFGRETIIPVVGHLLVEYETVSPQHDIPYRTQENEV